MLITNDDFKGNNICSIIRPSPKFSKIKTKAATYEDKENMHGKDNNTSMRKRKYFDAKTDLHDSCPLCNILIKEHLCYHDSIKKFHKHHVQNLSSQWNIFETLKKVSHLRKEPEIAPIPLVKILKEVNIAAHHGGEKCQKSFAIPTSKICIYTQPSVSQKSNYKKMSKIENTSVKNDDSYNRLILQFPNNGSFWSFMFNKTFLLNNLVAKTQKCCDKGLELVPAFEFRSVESLLLLDEDDNGSNVISVDKQFLKKFDSYGILKNEFYYLEFLRYFAALFGNCSKRNGFDFSSSADINMTSSSYVEESVNFGCGIDSVLFDSTAMQTEPIGIAKNVFGNVENSVYGTAATMFDNSLESILFDYMGNDSKSMELDETLDSLVMESILFNYPEKLSATTAVFFEPEIESFDETDVDESNVFETCVVESIPLAYIVNNTLTDTVGRMEFHSSNSGSYFKQADKIILDSFAVESNPYKPDSNRDNTNSILYCQDFDEVDDELAEFEIQRALKSSQVDEKSFVPFEEEEDVENKKGFTCDCQMCGFMDNIISEVSNSKENATSAYDTDSETSDFEFSDDDSDFEITDDNGEIYYNKFADDVAEMSDDNSSSSEKKTSNDFGFGSFGTKSIEEIVDGDKRNFKFAVSEAYELNMRRLNYERSSGEEIPEYPSWSMFSPPDSTSKNQRVDTINWGFKSDSEIDNRVSNSVYENYSFGDLNKRNNTSSLKLWMPDLQVFKAVPKEPVEDLLVIDVCTNRAKLAFLKDSAENLELDLELNSDLSDATPPRRVSTDNFSVDENSSVSSLQESSELSDNKSYLNGDEMLSEELVLSCLQNLDFKSSPDFDCWNTTCLIGSRSNSSCSAAYSNDDWSSSLDSLKIIDNEESYLSNDNIAEFIGDEIISKQIKQLGEDFSDNDDSNPGDPADILYFKERGILVKNCKNKKALGKLKREFANRGRETCSTSSFDSKIPKRSCSFWNDKNDVNKLGNMIDLICSNYEITGNLRFTFEGFDETFDGGSDIDKNFENNSSDLTNVLEENLQVTYLGNMISPIFEMFKEEENRTNNFFGNLCRVAELKIESKYENSKSDYQVDESAWVLEERKTELKEKFDPESKTDLPSIENILCNSKFVIDHSEIFPPLACPPNSTDDDACCPTTNLSSSFFSSESSQQTSFDVTSSLEYSLFADGNLNSRNLSNNQLYNSYNSLVSSNASFTWSKDQPNDSRYRDFKSKEPDMNFFPNSNVQSLYIAGAGKNEFGIVFANKSSDNFQKIDCEENQEDSNLILYANLPAERYLFKPIEPDNTMTDMPDLFNNNLEFDSNSKWLTFNHPMDKEGSNVFKPKFRLMDINDRSCQTDISIIRPPAPTGNNRWYSSDQRTIGFNRIVNFHQLSSSSSLYNTNGRNVLDLRDTSTNVATSFLSSIGI